MNYGERVFVDKHGELAVGTPLFRRMSKPLEKIEGYQISLENDKPDFWALEVHNRLGVLTTKCVAVYLEDLGPL